MVYYKYEIVEHQKKNGFTIVELLIVVVVIAILAAITIVAFNGMQDRAANTAKIQAAQQIAKSLDAAVTHSQIDFGVSAPYCLPTGNSDANSNGALDCGIAPAGGAYDRVEKDAANTVLRNANIQGLKYPDAALSGNDGRKYRGIQVTYGDNRYGIDGVLQPYFIYFFLKGDKQDCKSSYSVGWRTGNDNVNSPLTALVRAPYYGSANGVTICAYTIRHPSSL